MVQGLVKHSQQTQVIDPARFLHEYGHMNLLGMKLVERLLPADSIRHVDRVFFIDLNSRPRGKHIPAVQVVGEGSTRDLLVISLLVNGAVSAALEKARASRWQGVRLARGGTATQFALVGRT